MISPFTQIMDEGTIEMMIPDDACADYAGNGALGFEYIVTRDISPPVPLITSEEGATINGDIFRTLNLTLDFGEPVLESDVLDDIVINSTSTNFELRLLERVFDRNMTRIFEFQVYNLTMTVRLLFV